MCTSTSDCAAYGGTYISGACPGTPSNIKCCTKANCMWTTDNKCLGPSIIKWVNAVGQCQRVEAGKCPGPSLFRYVTGILV